MVKKISKKGKRGKTKKKLPKPKIKGKKKLPKPEIKGSSNNNNSVNDILENFKDIFVFKLINDKGFMGQKPYDINYITCKVEYTNIPTYIFGKKQLDKENVLQQYRKKIKLIEFSQETDKNNVFIESFLFPEPEKRVYNALKKLIKPRSVPGILHELLVLFIKDELKLPGSATIQLKDAWKGPCLRSKDLKKIADDKNYNYLYDYFYQRYKRLERGDYTLEQYTEDIKEGGYYGPWGFRLLEKTAMERDYGLLGKLQVRLEEYRILNGGR